MELTRRTMNAAGVISVVFMAVLLVLAVFRLVPDSFVMPFLAVAILLLVVRIALRIVLARQERMKSSRDR